MPSMMSTGEALAFDTISVPVAALSAVQLCVHP